MNACCSRRWTIPFCKLSSMKLDSVSPSRSTALASRRSLGDTRSGGIVVVFTGLLYRNCDTLAMSYQPERSAQLVDIHRERLRVADSIHRRAAPAAPERADH